MTKITYKAGIGLKYLPTTRNLPSRWKVWSISNKNMRKAVIDFGYDETREQLFRRAIRSFNAKNCLDKLPHDVEITVVSNGGNGNYILIPR